MSERYNVIARCVLNEEHEGMGGKMLNAYGQEHTYDTCDRKTAMRLVRQLNERYAGIYEFRAEVANG